MAVTKVASIVAFYVDGASVPTPAYNAVFHFTTPAGIGIRADSPQNTYLGSIDELSVYNRALTATEIVAIRNAGRAGKCALPGAPEILTQPASQSVTIGNPTSLNVVALGFGPYAYQWQLGGASIAGATNTSLDIASTQVSNAGNYTVTVTTPYGSVTSSNAVIDLSSPVCSPPPSGLVSWWRANGDAGDAIGGNNATLAQNASFGAGKVSQAFVFDLEGDVVLLGSATNLQLQNFTVEAWVQRSDLTRVSAAASGGVIFGFGTAGYALGLDNSGFPYLTTVGTGTVFASGGQITDGGWHHVAVTKLNSTVVFYVDGVAFSAPSTTLVYQFTTPAGIGALADQPAHNTFLGSIDELSVYNRALTASEILAIFNSGGDGKCFTPIPPGFAMEPGALTVVVGLNATLTSAAAGSGPYFYQWQLNGTNLPGATNATFAIAGAQLANAGVYTVVLSTPYGSTTSSGAQLTVFVPSCDPPPAGLVGWWKGDETAQDFAGANNGSVAGSATYGPGFVGPAFVFAHSGDGVSLANLANLQLQSFTIETWIQRSDPARASTSPGGGVIFGFGSGGYALGVTDAGQLFLTTIGLSEVTPSGGQITDTNWHHVAVTKTGASVVFYVDGTAYSAPAYSSQFQFTTTPGIGFTADTGKNSFLGSIDELSIYNRALASSEITAIFGAATAGKCFVGRQPAITTQPVSVTNVVGDSATLNVVASGIGILNFQWQHEGTNLPGRTNAALLLTNVQLANSGNYDVVVGSSFGSVTSSIVQLSVIPLMCAPPPPGLLSWWRAEQTASDSYGANDGSLAGKTDYGTGKVGFAFVFRGSGDGILLGHPANLQLQDLSIDAWIQRGDTAQASTSPGGGVLFGYGSGGYGFAMSDSGVLFLSALGLSQLTSTAPPINDTSWHHVAMTKSGTSVVFYLDGVAYPGPPFSSTPFTFSQGAAIGSLGDALVNTFFGSIDEMSIYNRALTGAEIVGIYNARSEGKCFTPVPPVISAQPAPQSVTVGNNAEFSVAATGPGPYTYQWRINAANLSGATNSTLIIRNAQPSSAGAYSVVITNPFGSVTSLPAQLSVNTAPTCVPLVNGLVGWWPAEGTGNDAVGGNTSAFTGQVGFGPGKVGSAFVFNGLGGGLIITNAPILQTQDLTIEAWVQRTSISSGGGVLFGFGGGGYSFNVSDAGSLSLIISGGGGVTAESVQISDTAWHHLVVTKSGIDVIFYVDGVSYSAPSFTAGPFQFTGNAAIGIRPDTLASAFLGSIDELAVYNRALTAFEVASIYNASTAGKCTAGVPPAVTLQPSGGSVTQGNNSVLNAAASGIGILHYQWRLNGNNIAGATNAALIVAGAQASAAGNYSLTISDAFGSVTSANALLTVSPAVCIEPTSGLVSWWPANGSTTDVVGGNNGTLSGQAGFIGGKVGLAFGFNGNGDGVLVGNPVNLQLQNFTIDAWVRRNNPNQAAASVGGGVIFGYSYGGYTFVMDDSGLLFLTKNGADSVAPAGGRITDTNWHHVAVTKAGTSVIFYVDDATYPAPAYSSTFVFTSAAAIGFIASNLQNTFLGSIDELSVYNRALTSTEIAGIYNASFEGKSRVNYLPPPRVGALIGINFTASTYGVDSPFIPPDANGTVGPAHFVELINGRFSVYDKATGIRLQTMSDMAFWTNAGVSFLPTVEVTDPRLVFDTFSQRWFASQIDFSGDPPAGGNHFLLAVSASSDPTGPWSAIQVIADPKTLTAADFPTLGVDANGVYLAADLFDSSGNRTGSTLTAFPKSSLLGSRASAVGLRSLGPLTYSTRGNILQPAVTIGPATGGESVLSVGDLGNDLQPHGNLFSFTLNGMNPNTAQNATLSAAISVNVPAYSVPFNPLQPDGSTNLDDGDARFSAQVYRIGDMLYAAHNVQINQRSAVQWYIINALNGTLIQSGQLTDPVLDLYYPSIAANTNGTAVIACNGSSLETYVTCFVAVGQTTNGVLAFAPLQPVMAGVASYQHVGQVSQRNRWGDYSATTVDPVNPSHFWTLQMYPSGSSVWSTQVTEIITDPPAGPPPLAIASASGMISLSWPATSAAYILQTSPSFPNCNWSVVTQAPVRVGSAFVVTVPVPADAAFFRLINP